MLRYLLILLLISNLSSCLVKKPVDQTPNSSENAISVVSRGLFTIKETLYFSNGKDSYCEVKDWEQAEYFRSKMQNKKIVFKLEDYPDSMKFIPVCTIDILIQK